MNPSYREDYELTQRLAHCQEEVRNGAEQTFMERFRNDLWRALLSWCAYRNVICRLERDSACARLFRRDASPEAVSVTATVHLPECEELSNMWVFLVEQSLLRARSYQGKAPLAHFVGTNLHKPWMYADYVRQHRKRVDIPKVLEGASSPVQDVYRYLRWGYRDEDLALRLDVPLEQAREWRYEVEDRLKQSGQYGELLVGRMGTAESESLEVERDGEIREVEVRDEAQPDLHTQVLIQGLQSALREIITRLPDPDQEVLQELYRHGRTAREVAASWQKDGRAFNPGGSVTQKQIEASVRRSMRTIVQELPQELARFGPEMEQILSDTREQKAFLETLKEYLRLNAW